ncbi:exonuclease domain-containing protein [Ruminococcus sp.]|uniref:exonuclease domain-containing protein n=1 Tax=Ruminococcus sp. TaxID=41978 RepID=UPI0025CE0080|nr:exonuclease domain-containing protein [Ruminococcus sp.]
MQVKISEFLKDYSLELPESVLGGEIFKLTYSENLENIRFHARFEELVPSDDIFAFEKAVEAAIKVEQVRLACRYPSEKFGMDCYDELIKLLKRDIPVVNGFLDDADVSFVDSELRIRIVHGGREILDRYSFCRYFSQMIYNQFGVRVKVFLEGDSSVSREQFDEMIERIEADMPDYSAQLVPEKSAEEIRAEEVKAVIPTVTIDIGALNKDFDAESAEIVKGKAIREKPIPICEAVQHLGEKVVVVGDVFASDMKEVRGEKTVVTYDITDYSGSLKLKIFAKNEEVEELKLGSIKSGAALLVSGKLDYDSFARDIVISVNSLIKVKRIPKMDNYPEKRVELHCHSNMSAMDAVTDPVTLISRAAEWGHQAMAITDHGCVQAFPDCMYNMPKDFKVIYGMEAYVVNDIERDMVVYGDDNRSFDDEIIIFDVETTGLSYRNDRLTEIGAVKLKNMQVVDDFNTKVNPGFHIPEHITELTGISDADVANAPDEGEALKMFMEFCGDKPVLVAHNARYDTTMIGQALKRCGIVFDYTWVDTLVMCQSMLPEIGRHKLNLVAKQLKLGKFDHHRASDDALMLAKIYITLIGRLNADRGFGSIQQLNTLFGEI